MKRSWRRVLSIILTVAMVLSIASPIFAADSSDDREPLDVTWEKVENTSSLKKQADSNKKDDPIQTEAIYNAKDVVRVSIILERRSTIDAGFSTKGISTNASAQQYREKLRKEQNALESRISAEALGGKKLDVVWNLTLAANLISANVEYGQIEAIRNVIGVKDVVLETRYEPALAGKDELEPEMSIASGMTGGQFAWAEGYTGAGEAIAIVDTGLDTDHQSFDSGAFDYSLEQLDKTAGITKDFVESKLEQLNVYSQYAIKYGKELKVDDVYLNSKVPFAFNYVDKDLDVTHDNDGQGEHGSHVAGIAAANSYIPDGKGGYKEALTSVLTQGEAPDAQLMVMKVFGKGGGAYDSDYMAAIEDSIILGAASTNLSLGTGVAGFVNADEDTYQEILDSLTNTDLVLVISAGNAYSWAEFTPLKNYLGHGFLFSEDINFDTVGSPGSYTNSLTVASVDNNGSTGAFIEAGDELIAYNESNEYGNAPFITLAGEREFAYVDSVGIYTDDNDNIIGNDFASLDLTGKIAIVNRGVSSFYMKANAAVGAGACGVIVANNQAGIIMMNLTGYEFTAPAVTISQDDAAYLKSLAESSEKITSKEGNEFTVYYGKLTVLDEMLVLENEGKDYVMSDFSSWGVPGDLSLKPEITAPGGNIYSVNGLGEATDQYENLSGTSMAAPQIAGLAAVMAQYIKDNDLTTKTNLSVRQLINSLFMSTATPLIELDSEGEYYSVMKQGAGLVQLDKAMNSRTYILMDEDATASAADGKIKAELGETGNEFKVGFTVYNLTDEDISLDLNADFFTQDRFQWYTFDAAGNPVTKNGSYVISEYFDTWTKELPTTVTWFVNDEKYSSDLDINGDGALDENDAADLLSYVLGNVEDTTDWNLEAADFDADGDIDTYDAYLILDACCDGGAKVPANGSVHIEVLVAIDDIEYNSYVEGYIFAAEADTADGAKGVEHSIPVLGYYGDWSEPSMFDKGSYLEYLYDLESIGPYLSYEIGEKAELIESFIYEVDGDTYYFGGNPIITDTDENGDNIYLPERNAVSSDNSMYSVRYTQIRNSGAGRFTVTDPAGSVLFEKLEGPAYPAYYYVNGQAWQNYSTVFEADYKSTLVPEGTQLTYSFTLAPEYFVDANGEVDWNNISENNTLSIAAVVDNTAPEIQSIDAFKDVEIDDKGNKIFTYDLTFELLDNQYIAAIGIMDEANYKAMMKGYDYDYIDVQGADINAQANETTTYNFLYTSRDSETPDQLLVEVYDYALNQTTYKLNMKQKSQLNDEESYKIEFVSNPMTIINNGSKQLEWFVDPWGIDELDGYSISFKSSDETIATVDENGLVTSVAPEDATCIVTATMSYNGITVSEDCEIRVKFVDKELKAVIWDEEGKINFSDFNLKSIPDYNRLSDPVGNDIASVAVDMLSGKAFAASLDTKDMVSSLYELNPETYELTKIGDSGIGYMDLAAAPIVSALAEHDYLVSVYGYYVVIVDAETGGYAGVYNLSRYTGGNYFVGAAYGGSHEDKDYGYLDEFFLVDESGALWMIDLGCDEADPMLVYLYSLGNTGFSTDEWYFNSLYAYFGEPEIVEQDNNASTEDAEEEPGEEPGEEEEIEIPISLVWSCFNHERSIVDIILIDDIFGEGSSISNVGTFAKDVWPIGGIYEDVVIEEIEGEETGSLVSRRSNASLQPVAENIAPTTEIETLRPVGTASVKGGLNAAKQGDASELPMGVEPPENEEFYTSDEYVYITLDEKAHSGLIEVTYDPAEIEVYDFYDISTLMYYFGLEADFADMNYGMNDDGTFTISMGFISRVALAQDEYMAILNAGVTEDICEAEITVATKQINNEEGETVVLPFVEHDFCDWTETKAPTCTEKGEETGYCSKCDATETRPVDALGHDPVHHDAQAPTCTEAGWDEYDTCSRCDYTTYAEIEALGHDLTHHEGQEATCTEGGWEEYDTCSRCDYTTYKEIAALGHHVVRHEAKAATCTEAGWGEYVTCSRCDYTTYVEIAALGHNLVHHEAQDPTCTGVGWDAYDTCSRCNYTTYAEKAAIDHDWGSPEYVWAEDNSTLTASRACKNDPTHIDSETVPAVFAVITDATCEKAGSGIWVSSSFNNSVFSIQTKTVEIPVADHTSGEPVHENEAAAGYWTEGGYDEVVYCSVCNEELSRTHVTLPALTGATDNGSSLSLKDNISVNIYAGIPGDAEGWTAKVFYEKDDFAEAVSTYNLDKTAANGYSSKNDEYKFVYSNISAKEMTEKVRVIIYDENGDQVKIKAKDGTLLDCIDFCAADWANAMISDSTRPAATVNLAKALLNYGGEAQNYWEYKPEANANAAGYLAEEMAKVTADDLKAFAPVKDDNASAVGENGISLSLKSETYLNVYFTKEVTVSAANLNGAKIAVSKSGKEWVAKITGITAKNLGNQYTLTVKNGSTTSTQEYSALSWAYNILNGTSENAKPLAKALYLYQQAAVEYFK